MATNNAPRTAAALHARRATTDNMVQRITVVLRQMGREHAAATVAAVARRARVSRTFLYQNERARGLVAAGGGAAWCDAARRSDAKATAVQATWRERIGELLGQIRDLEANLPPDGVQQLLTETHTLKAQNHRLAQDNRRPEERLTGARDNNRFLDKRFADLATRAGR